MVLLWIMNDIYNNIKAVRASKGLTQNVMAEKLNMTQSNYTKLERGLTQITIERLEEIAVVFEMSIWSIVNYDGDVTIEKSDIESWRNEVLRLQTKLEKLQKENDELNEDYYKESWDKNNTEERHKKEMKAIKQKTEEMAKLVAEKDKRIEEQSKTISNQQDTISFLMAQISASKQ
ncbi:MAG: helix-turn-helix domain-containing protein [Cytophagia bacterium]|nr:MAG: helix-turn-helix domain-containing protein [Runella sp.]TAG21597.1 MAG: helix-turn-helix domain-containing protein [Cytophagales bacterium]TAG40860.1 MAG: helix-turn-helix domain-containing protein [Cytophagia bacterium]TAG54202.1 MAG: helix-turn-helix domain-containing protein [Runella slithyformis]TAG82399.1 MAG: helix-turn-helix domain-containing protein [Cytophagales bacterium]